MKIEPLPPLFANEEHRRNYDTLLERRSTARMWLRANGRMPKARAPEIPEWLRRKRRATAA